VRAGRESGMRAGRESGGMRAGRWWMLGVTCLSVAVVGLDLTVLNIALPAISAALHASTRDLQWIVDAYSLAFAGVMLPAGMIGDRAGRRRLLLAGLAVFLAASVWCALSVSAGELIAARATPIPVEQARARERIWTPEKVHDEVEDLGAATPGRLWTPTDQRSAS